MTSQDTSNTSPTEEYVGGVSGGRPRGEGAPGATDGAEGRAPTTLDDASRTTEAMFSIEAGPSSLLAETAIHTPSERASTAGGEIVPGTNIGRYRIVRRIGSGGFGSVYLARDDELNRLVALKVPHACRLRPSGELGRFLHEARILAELDHAAIVPVYDAGPLEEAGCFVVSKYIDGTSLDRRLRVSPLDPKEAASWIATAAEALHSAHLSGVIHRDIKPANLLIGAAGRLYVADFGLALRERDLDAVPAGFAGTPAYTSPEQARREGHRVDARADLFSLGVVFYETLTGRNPFRGSNHHETLRNIVDVEPPGPREVDPNIPAELDRICRKAMAKRLDDRYATAAALAADLRHWLARARIAGAEIDENEGPRLALEPRGLRPYEAADAGPFLELLPGPRGRDLLPESLSFWRDRIEPTDAEEEGVEPFCVGVLYGPTGSGKSSLVRAGLLPRLASCVQSVLVEATADETEARLLCALRGRFPDLAGEADLISVLRALRQGQGLPGAEKALIVLDQFEQWLARPTSGDRRPLQDALRQCDGRRVQALLLVRDEFWMPLTRFARELEVRLVDGGNSAAVDLFDLEHARKVLTSLGRAFGRLHGDGEDLNSETRAFLDLALDGLAQDGRVVCVRLVLFAELLKDRPWTPATLGELGGARQVGVAFLEEAFFSPTAPPRNRLHQAAACEVLRRLLPEPGATIKGHRCSREELMRISGYAADPEAFDELIWILDHELRLVTPADPGEPAGPNEPPARRAQSYGLTHDYLIPDLREWLLRHKQGTIRGRAELRLQEFASLWSRTRNPKFLPTAGEWLIMRVLTARRRWTDAQRQMMRVGARRHARRHLVAGCVLAVCIVLASQWIAQVEALGLVKTLGAAKIDQVARITRELESSRSRVLPILKRAVNREDLDARERLNYGIALLADDPGQLDYLIGRLLSEDLVTSLTIGEALRPARAQAVGKLWAVALDPNRPEPQRLRAALTLARHDPPGQSAASTVRWSRIATPLADALVTALDTNPIYFSPVVAAIRPIGPVLIEPLEVLFRSEENERRSMATNLLAILARDRPEILGRLILVADLAQFRKLCPLLDRHHRQVLEIFAAEASRSPTDEPAARRRAIAILCLLRANDPRIPWQAFENAPNPAMRTHLIHNVAPYGIPPTTLIDRLAVEDNPSILRGLLLALGQYPALRQPDADRQRLAGQVRERFLGHPDAGVHAAARWLLRQIGCAELAVLEDSEQPGPPGSGPANWYVTSEGQVMVILDARDEPSIGRVFAIAATETTVAQFRRFLPKHWTSPQITTDENSPAGVMTWKKAVDYCEWLNTRESIAESQSCYFGPGARKQGDLIVADLERTGYRLPTQAEWEYACRAGTRTSRYFGDRDDLLGCYAWYYENCEGRLWPVGRLMPNDFGLFDMYGNVSEWTSDLRHEGRRALIVGGAYNVMADALVSSMASPGEPFVEFNSYGFRCARTLNPGD